MPRAMTVSNDTGTRVLATLGRGGGQFEGVTEYAVELERRAGADAMRLASDEFDNALHQSSVTRASVRPPAIRRPR